jgi:hypothetical protein
LSLGEATTTITGIKTEFDTFDTGTPINLADMKLAVQTEIKKILEFASKHDHDGLCQYFASSSAGDNQKAAKANTYYGGIGHGIRSSLGFATKKDKKLEEDHQKQQQQEQQKRDHGLDENGE